MEEAHITIVFCNSGRRDGGLHGVCNKRLPLRVRIIKFVTQATIIFCIAGAAALVYGLTQGTAHPLAVAGILFFTVMLYLNYELLQELLCATASLKGIKTTTKKLRRK